MAPRGSMRLGLAPAKSLLPGGIQTKGRDGLLFQRLFWGAMTGCLATLLLAESPVLESMELTTLEWRYKVSDFLAGVVTEPKTSKDVSIVEFDDLSQFDMAVSRFNDARSQKILAN